jgi:hypothetical protein
MSSFINDEKGVIEPYTDLSAMALAVVGFVVFFALVSQTYTAYQQKSVIAEHYQDVTSLADKLSRDSILTGSTRPDIIDAAKVEKIKNDPEELMKKYGAHYNFMVKVEADSASRAYSVIIREAGITESKIGVSASIPVTVRINDVQEFPGTLTVKIWKK